MKLRDDLNAITPRLRRYARALVTGRPGGSDRADDLVHATLMRALGSRNLGMPVDLLIRLYATLTQLHRDIEVKEETAHGAEANPALVADAGMARAPAVVRQSRLTAGLMSLPLDDREALLLVALENFSHEEAARILRISRVTLVARLSRARAALEASLRVAAAGIPAPHSREAHTYLRLVK